MVEKTDKGSGSFCIPQYAMHLLSRGYVMNKKVMFIKADVICAYLVIANFTAPDGVRSTAGVQAIERYVQCGIASAERQIKELVRIGVIEDLRAELGDDKYRLDAVRFLVKDFDEPLEERAWIDRSLVEYINPKTKQSNLDRLCAMRSACIRMLLWMYCNLPVGATTVQHPIPHEGIAGVMTRFKWDEDQTRMLDSHEVRVACSPEFDLQGCDLRLWYSLSVLKNAVKDLMTKGFIYEVIVVWEQPLTASSVHEDDAVYLDVEARPLYQLHTVKCNGELSDDEVGVSHLTLKASQYADVNVFSHEGEVDNKYVVISEPGQIVAVAGVYRMSHRVTNNKNRGVKEAWSAIMDPERAYRRWLVHTMEDAYGVDLENLAQAKRFEAKTQMVMKRVPQPVSVMIRGGR